MKVLTVTQDKDKFHLVEKCLKEKFLDLNIIYSHSMSSTMDLLINDGPFAFFMMDMDFEGDKVELLNDMMNIAGERPIIICVDEKQFDSIDKRLILKNENNTVLRDINDEEKIYQATSVALRWSEKNHFDQRTFLNEKEEADLIPIKIRNLYTYESFPYSLYVKIADGKYIMALEGNTPINDAQIAKLVHRKIKFLHIEKDKHLHFLHSSMQKAIKYFITNKEFNRKTVKAHLRSTALIQDYLLNVGVTVKLTEFVDRLLQHMIETLDSKHQFYELNDYLKLSFESIISKGVFTAYLSFFLTREMGWKSATVRNKFLLAGIIQDTFIPTDDMAKLKTFADPRITEFTDEEIRAYPNHPQRIAELARQLGQYPDIDFLLEQHHELPGRNGFPNRPPPTEMQMAVCVFNLASNFARDLDGQECNKETYTRLMKIYQKDFNVGNFKTPLLNLKKCLNVS